MDEQFSSKLNDKIGELKALVNHVITEEELENSIRKLNDNAKKLVHDRPVQALLGALAVGFILGKILKR